MPKYIPSLISTRRPPRSHVRLAASNPAELPGAAPVSPGTEHPRPARSLRAPAEGMARGGGTRHRALPEPGDQGEAGHRPAELGRWDRVCQQWGCRGLALGCSPTAALCRAVAELGVRLAEFPPAPDLTRSIPDSPWCSPEAQGQALFNPSQLL